MLFAPLDLGFHAPASLLPLAEISVRLLVSPLVGQLLVLVREPNLFQLLFLDIRGRVVVEIVAAPFKLVCSRELDLLVVVRVEGLLARLERGTLSLCESPRCVRKLY